MTIENTSSLEDRLVGVASDVAQRVELHTHVAGDNGVMRMTEIEGGIPLPAGSTHVMKRGGDHVMFMGLKAPLEQGGEINVTFTFEKAGEMTVQIPVDHDRKAMHKH